MLLTWKARLKDEADGWGGEKHNTVDPYRSAHLSQSHRNSRSAIVSNQDGSFGHSKIGDRGSGKPFLHAN